MKNFNRILLVDDDLVSTYLNELIFNGLGVAKEVLICSDSEEALELIKSDYIVVADKQTDIIILDLDMPIIDGFQILEELIAMGQINFISTKIAVLTSSKVDQDRERVIKLGVKHILRKPLTREAASQLIQNIRGTNGLV